MDVIKFEIEPYFIKFGLILINGNELKGIGLEDVVKNLSEFDGVKGEKASELLSLIDKTISTDGKYGATFATNGEIIVVIKLGKIPSLMRATSILVHELSHVCIYAFNMKNIPLNNQTHEAFAYLIQNLFEKTSETVENAWKLIHTKKKSYTKNKKKKIS